MQNKLSSLYEHEQATLQETLAHFNIHHHEQDNPLYSEIINAFAFAAARIKNDLLNTRHINQLNLQNILLPQINHEKPLYSIAQFTLQSDQSSTLINKGTLLASNDHHNPSTRWQTVFTNKIRPIQINNIELSQAASSQHSKLSFILQSNDPSTSLNTLLEDAKLVIYINLEANDTKRLFKLLFMHLSHIEVKADGNSSIILDRQCITPLTENLEILSIDHPTQTFPIHQAISDYLNYPDLFNFLQLDLSEVLNQLTTTSSLNVTFFFDDPISNFAKRINDHSLQLNCIPVINTIITPAKPICIEQQQCMRALHIDDFHNGAQLEIISIQSVSISKSHYSKHETLSSQQWHALQDENQYWKIEFNLADDFNDQQPWIAHIELLCRQNPANIEYSKKLQFFNSSPDNIQTIELINAAKPSVNDASHSTVPLPLLLQIQRLESINKSRLLDLLLIFSDACKGSIISLFESINCIETKPTYLAIKHHHDIVHCPCLHIQFHLLAGFKVNEHMFMLLYICYLSFKQLAPVNTVTKVSVIDAQQNEVCRWPIQS